MPSARPSGGPVVTIRDLPVGATGTLVRVNVEDGQRMRLAELGLRPGERVTVAQRGVGGARVLAVHGSRIAVDARTAGRLDIRPEDAA